MQLRERETKMIIDINLLEEAGYNVDVNNSIITIESPNAECFALAEAMKLNINLPPNIKDRIIDETITKVNNEYIMVIINGCF